MIRPHPRVLYLITKTLFLTWEPQFSTDWAKIQQILFFCIYLRESGFANSPAWICKDSFCAIVLRIRQDLWGFVGFVTTARIFGSWGHETNPRFESLRIGLTNPDSRICEVRIRDYDTKRIFLESGFVTTIQNESTFLQISYTNPASLIYLHFSVWSSILTQTFTPDFYPILEVEFNAYI